MHGNVVVADGTVPGKWHRGSSQGESRAGSRALSKTCHVMKGGSPSGRQTGGPPINIAYRCGDLGSRSCRAAKGAASKPTLPLDFLVCRGRRGFCDGRRLVRYCNQGDEVLLQALVMEARRPWGISPPAAQRLVNRFVDVDGLDCQQALKMTGWFSGRSGESRPLARPSFASTRPRRQRRQAGLGEVVHTGGRKFMQSGSLMADRDINGARDLACALAD